MIMKHVSTYIYFKTMVKSLVVSFSITLYEKKFEICDFILLISIFLVNPPYFAGSEPQHWRILHAVKILVNYT